MVGNFFHAIHSGALTVTVEPDTDSELLDIDHESLESWFNDLLENEDDTDAPEDENEGVLRQAYIFSQIIKEDTPTSETQDADLGHCRLWIRAGEGLPSKVALVRRTGMLVTTEQSRLIRFPRFKDFAAVCVFEDPMGNELLRGMENPQHDKFEPDRLAESDRVRGRRALNRITRWIRSEIQKAAGPPEGTGATVLSELAVFLPYPQPDEPFGDINQDDEETREPGFGDRVKVTLKPVRRPTPPALPDEEEEKDEGDAAGDDTGSAGGPGTGENGGGGGGQGDSDGSSGGRRSKHKLIPVSNVRMLAIEGSENTYRISFRADGSGIAKLDLDEAGDSFAIPRNDIRTVDSSVNLSHFPLIRGELHHLEITADSPIGGRSWRLTAADVVEE